MKLGGDLPVPRTTRRENSADLVAFRKNLTVPMYAGVALERRRALPARHVPQPSLPVARARRHRPRVRAHRHAGEVRLTDAASTHRRALTAGNVPQSSRRVLRARHQCPPVCAQRNSGDVAGVALERRRALPARHIPQPSRLIP